jgi:hypothetical protein
VLQPEYHCDSIAARRFWVDPATSQRSDDSSDGHVSSELTNTLLAGLDSLAWYIKNSLRNTVHSVDHLELRHFIEDHN